MTSLELMTHACNISPWEAEAVGVQVRDQPELYSQTLSQANKDLIVDSHTFQKKALSPFLLSLSGPQ